jgi:hypothetical protein
MMPWLAMRLNLGSELLFSKHDLLEFLHEQFSEDAVAQRVNALPKDKFLAATDEELAEHFKALLDLRR